MAGETIQQLRALYARKYLAAGAWTALAAVIARLLYDGDAGAHALWVFALFLVAGGLAWLRGIETAAMRRQLRQLALIESGSKIYGNITPLSRGDAADDFSRPPPKR